MRIWPVSTLIAASLASVLATSLTAAPAFAQKPQPQPREDVTMAEARQRFNEGMKFADDGNHEAARLKFSQAWSLLKSPAILYNLARSEQLSGHLVEALEHYLLFGKMSSDPKVTEQQKQRALENIATISEKVGQIDVDAPPNAQIAIDGKAVEWTSQSDPIPVMPGSHEVTATVDGTPTKVTVECAPGTVTKARLRDAAKPATPAGPPPPATTATTATTTVTTPSADGTESHWSAGRIAGLAVAGGGLVAVGLGFYFHFDSTSAGEDADTKVNRVGPSGCHPSMSTKPPECADISDLRDQQDSSAFVRHALWIGGGAMVVGGAALFLLSSRKSDEKPRAWNVLPAVSSKGSGLVVVGAF